MELHTIIINLISCLYTAVILSFIGKSYKDNIFKYSIAGLILFICIITLMFFFPAFANSVYEPYVILIVVLASYMIIFKDNLFNSFFYLLFGFLAVMLLQTLILPALYIFGITLEDALTTPWIAALVESLCFVIVIALAWFNVFSGLKPKLTKFTPYFVSFTLNVYIFMQLGRIIINYMANGGPLNYVYLYSLFIAFVFLNVYLIWYVIKNQRELDQKKSYNEYEKMIIPLIENSRAIEHDFKNHLLTLKSMSKGNDEKINEYIKEISGDINNSSVYKLCSNPVMGALLQEKHGYATERNIDFDIQVYENENQTEGIKPHHLITVLSNLIDNAIEESEKSNDKRITVKYTHNENVNISVTNSLSQQKNIENMKSNSRYSTKGSGRGYGLNNIKRIAKQYNGDMAIYHMGETIEIKVSLNP